MRPVHKLRIKLQQPQYGAYKYGGGNNTSNSNSLLWTASWNANNKEILACLDHYSKFVINKVKIVLHSFRLKEFLYLLGEHKQSNQYVRHTWPISKDMNTHQSFVTKYKELNDGHPPDFQDLGEIDGTRTLVFWSNNLAIESRLGLEPSDHEHARRIPLRRYLKVTKTLYCKPKKYYMLLPGQTQLPDAKTILKTQDSPLSIINNQIFIAPSKEATDPDMDSKDNLLLRSFNYTSTYYVTLTFAGRRPNM